MPQKKEEEGDQGKTSRGEICWKTRGGSTIQAEGHELKNPSPLSVTRQGLHRGEWQEMKLVGTFPQSALGSNPVMFTTKWLEEMGIHGKAEMVGW